MMMMMMMTMMTLSRAALNVFAAINACILEHPAWGVRHHFFRASRSLSAWNRCRSAGKNWFDTEFLSRVACPG